eukprot:4842907-Prymnesium_polylepis.1
MAGRPRRCRRARPVGCGTRLARRCRGCSRESSYPQRYSQLERAASRSRPNANPPRHPSGCPNTSPVGVCAHAMFVLTGYRGRGTRVNGRATRDAAHEHGT